MQSLAEVPGRGLDRNPKRWQAKSHYYWLARKQNSRLANVCSWHRIPGCWLAKILSADWLDSLTAGLIKFPSIGWLESLVADWLETMTVVWLESTR